MPDDYGTLFTDAKFDEVRARLSELYRQAEKDLSEKIKDFWERHRKRDEKYRALVAAGKMSKEDYQAWLRGQVFQGQQWSAKRAQIIREMEKIDETAYQIVNGEKEGIFLTNANYVGYDIESGLHTAIGFESFDSNTVARLIRDNPNLLPPLSPEKLAAVENSNWYQRVVTNSITQGIIQGEGVEKICKRILSTCTDRSEKAALRDARTAYTGAQNAGRIVGMHQAQSLGIDVKKRWICTLDMKTRPAHRELDGVTVDVDKPFTVNGDTIEYPGDPHAKGYLVYNCRCTLGWIYPRYNQKITRRDNMSGEDAGAITYKEWFEKKQQEIRQ